MYNKVVTLPRYFKDEKWLLAINGFIFVPN